VTWITDEVLPVLQRSDPMPARPSGVTLRRGRPPQTTPPRHASIARRLILSYPKGRVESIMRSSKDTRPPPASKPSVIIYGSPVWTPDLYEQIITGECYCDLIPTGEECDRCIAEQENP